MTDDERMTWGFILDVLNVLERHGYHRVDNRHTGETVGLIGRMARIYEGTMDDPGGAYVVVPSSRPTAPQPPGPDAVTLSGAEVTTLLAALDDAAESNRDRAAACADCNDQPCRTCQSRLHAADTYDRTAARLLQTEAASPAAADKPPPEPQRTSEISAQPPAADKEAGQ